MKDKIITVLAIVSVILGVHFISMKAQADEFCDAILREDIPKDCDPLLFLIEVRERIERASQFILWLDRIDAREVVKKDS